MIELQKSAGDLAAVAFEATAPMSEIDRVARVRAEWATCEQAEGDWIRAAVTLGLELSLVKASAEYGEFEPWVQKNIFPELTLRRGQRFHDTGQAKKICRYMQAATEACRRVGIELVTPSGDTVSPLRKLLADTSAESPLAWLNETLNGTSLRQLLLPWSREEQEFGGDAVWRHWAEKHAPEFAEGPRKAAPKEVRDQFTQSMVREAQKAMPPEERVKAANAEVARLTTEVDELRDNLSLMAADQPLLQRLAEVLESTAARVKLMAREPDAKARKAAVRKK